MPTKTINNNSIISNVQMMSVSSFLTVNFSYFCKSARTFSAFFLSLTWAFIWKSIWTEYDLDRSIPTNSISFLRFIICKFLPLTLLIFLPPILYLFSFWDASYTCQPTWWWALFYLFSCSPPLYFNLDNFYWLTLFSFSSAMSALLINLSKELFNSNNPTILRISIWLFKIVSISLL